MRRAGRLVLDQVSLSVEPGQVVVVHGRRGAGKSTLLAIGAAALAPTEGKVFIAGRSIGGLQRGSRPYVRRNIGYLPAAPSLIHRETALENVMWPLGVRGASLAAAEVEARAVLGRVGLGRRGNEASIPVDELSASGRLLVAVARALAGAPPVIILDDPAAGLDEMDRTHVLTALAEAGAAGSAVLCASPDVTFVEALEQRGGRRLTLEDGHLGGQFDALGRPSLLRLIAPDRTPPEPADATTRSDTLVVRDRRSPP